MISRKHSMLIKRLAEKEGYSTAEELSQEVAVSVRTIKRYMQDLDYFLHEYGVDILSTKGLGYKIVGPVKEMRRLHQEIEQYLAGFQIDDSTEGRITKILCAFINKEYVHAEELSQTLNLSIASTNKLISAVKAILRQYNLRLVSKPFRGSKLAGAERNIRALMLEYAIKSDETNALVVRLDNVLTGEIEDIEHIITEALMTENIILADKDFNILLTRVILSVGRTRKGCRLENTMEENYRFHNYELVREIMNRVGQKLGLDIDDNEILYVSSSSGMIMYDYNTRMQLALDTKDEISKFVEEALADISLVTDLDLRQDENFVKALVLHLRIFINRYRAGIGAKNPLLEQIKVQFPMETSVAAIMAKKLKDELNVVLDEDEIGFITMHFGAALEKRKSTNGKRVCIICHYGIGTSQLLAEKLKQRISDITIVGTYPVRYLDIALKEDIDFIVSTVKLENPDVKVPVLYIENVFSPAFLNEVHQVCREKEERKTIFQETFHRDAFFRIQAETPEEAIQAMGNKLKDRGYIDDKVIAKVLEREKMSSTDIGNLVAIPHTILEEDYKSVIGVGVLDKPIIWKKEEVQLIFMVSFNRKESRYFSMFKYLYEFIADEGEVRRVIKACSFDKLMNILR